MAGKLGRLPNRATQPRLRLAQFATAVPPPPASANWYSRVLSWPMYANDSVGDCTCAEIGHTVGSASAYTSSEVEFTDQQILAVYSAVTGYNPADPSTDQGAVIQDVLTYWRKTGIAGHKLLAFAEVDVSNRTEVMQAAAAFGSLDLGHTVTSGDMSAFDGGKAWSTSYAAGPVEGGHSTELVGYDSGGGWLVTWGQVQRFTWAWWQARMEEAWLPILPEWMDAQGESPSGFDLHGLGQRMADLTGDPNPFPAPGPTPDDADHALWAVGGPWAAQFRNRPDLVTLKASLIAWAKAKGLS